MLATQEMLATDELLAKLLDADIPGGWVKFIGDTLHHKGMNENSAQQEDLLVTIVNELVLALQTSDSLKTVVANAYGDLNKLKPTITAAVHFRYRDFRKRKIHQIGKHEFPENFTPGKKSQDLQELDARELHQAINLEFQRRKSQQSDSSLLDLAFQFMTDKVNGLELKEIYQKHGISKGSRTQKIMQEITSVVKTVAQKLGEHWIINFIK